jgi:hypothetical protein
MEPPEMGQWDDYTLEKSETRFNTDQTGTHFFVVRPVYAIVIISLSPKSHS